MKRIGIIVSSAIGILSIVVIVIFVKSMYNAPASGMDAMKPYEKRLEELNKELGSNMVIYIPETDPDYDEQVSFYTSMTIEEFDRYIRDMNEKAKEYDKQNNLSDVPYKNITEEEFKKLKQKAQK